MIIDTVVVVIACVASSIGCYVFGNMRAMRIIEYRERQSAHLFGDPVVYFRCICGHNTVSHAVGEDGTRGKCTTKVSNDVGTGTCACQGCVPDPRTKVEVS